MDISRGKGGRETNMSHMFDSEDADRIYVRRRSDVYQLGLKREQEIYGYGLLQNPIAAFLNPALFAWRFPIFPAVSVSAMYDYGKSFAAGGSDTLADMSKRMSNSARNIRSDTLRSTIFFHRDMVMCSSCGHWKARFGACDNPNCRGRGR